ncbi:hypothetical protein F5148DRAFT_1147753 [Russula earlei]|uniref:Uncharacterized protein n=1 Tax=Russula earlei TaxID=71964 RepID=A0ACC0UGN2_9AGAM|nr:hypothetical protein F5148DRAFT_1147753 [Russula earlei]
MTDKDKGLHTHTRFNPKAWPPPPISAPHSLSAADDFPTCDPGRDLCAARYATSASHIYEIRFADQQRRPQTHANHARTHESGDVMPRFASSEKMMIVTMGPAGPSAFVFSTATRSPTHRSSSRVTRQDGTTNGFGAAVMSPSLYGNVSEWSAASPSPLPGAPKGNQSGTTNAPVKLPKRPMEEDRQWCCPTKKEEKANLNEAWIVEVMARLGEKKNIEMFEMLTETVLLRGFLSRTKGDKNDTVK